MAVYNFRIKNGNIDSGELMMQDKGDTKVEKKFVLHWTVLNRSESRVASITSIDLKTGSSRDLFSTLEGVGSAPFKKWKGVIKSSAPEGEYLYKILWMDKDGKGPHTYDPKIAVMPSSSFSSLSMLIRKMVSVVLMVVALFGFFKLFSLRNKNKSRQIIEPKHTSKKH